MTERTNDDWLAHLSARDGPAIADLRSALYRGLTAALAGRADAAAVEDFAQEAVLRVLDRLGDFRRESRFLTWATASAVRIAFTELRKARYRDVSLDALTAETADGQVQNPPDAEELRSLLDALRRLVRTELTDRQRTVIEGELAGVPQAVLADRLGVTRNALYKLGHDARKRLRRAIESEGFSADGVRTILAGASD